MKKISLSLLSIYFIFVCSLSQANSLRIGTLFFDPPLVMSPTQGFEIDFINTVCQRLNLSCELIPMEFNKLFSAVQDEEIDLAIGGIAISPRRQQHFIFSLPYKISSGQFLSLQGNNLHSLSDLKAKKVGVIQGEAGGGVFSRYLVGNYANLFTIILYKASEDIMIALTNKKIDAAFIHQSSALYWLQNGGNQFKKLGNPVHLGEGIAIMALPKNKSLIQQINDQIQKMEEDYTYLNLYNTYFSNEQ